jgi:hypothetical protein
MINFKKIILSITLLNVFVGINARTVSLSVSSLGRNPDSLSIILRNYFIGLGDRDTAVIYFDKDSVFNINGTAEFNCNVVMKGLHENRTIVELGNENGMFNDDCFFSFKPLNVSRKISVDVSNITVRIKNHDGIWWLEPYSEKYAFKVNYACRVSFSNVNIKLRNGVITNLDMRSCDNINVRNCNFENYNNCIAGGCLWIRGGSHNINVNGNVFHKYGNDEAFALWGCDGGLANDTVVKENVKIYNNIFYYGVDSDSISNKWAGSIDVLFSIYSPYDSNNRFSYLKNVSVKGNSFVMGDKYKTIIGLSFTKANKLDGFEFDSNTVSSTMGASQIAGWVCDLIVNDSSIINNVLTFSNNKFTHNSLIKDLLNMSSHHILGIHNGSINLDNNTVVSTNPYSMLWALGSDKCNISMTGNNLSNLGVLAKLDEANTINDLSFLIRGNTLSGDTRIYCRNIKSLSIVSIGNVINASNYHFFLQEFASQGSVIFENNVVNESDPLGGVIYANYSGTSPCFTGISIRNNTFNNLGSDCVNDKFTNFEYLNISDNHFSR